MRNYSATIAACIFLGILPFNYTAQAQVNLGLKISGGQSQITVTGPTGSNCELQYVTNLAGTNIWIPRTNFTLTSSPFLVTDPTFPLQSQRFYRVRVITATNTFQVVNAIVTNATKVVVSFNKPVDPASVDTSGSQFVLLGGSLSTLAASVAGSQVTLTTTTQTHGENYLVFVTASVKSLENEPIDSQHNQAAFTGF